MKQNHKLEKIYGMDQLYWNRFNGGVVKILKEDPEIEHCVIVEKLFSKKGIPITKNKFRRLDRSWLKPYTEEGD